MLVKACLQDTVPAAYSWTNTDFYAMVGRALRKWNSGGATWQIWVPKQHWFVGYWAWEGMSLRDLKVALNGPQRH